jgi:hypothetical protein
VIDTNCFRSKFKITCNSTVICAHFNKMYIWACTMVICYFWRSILKDNENWLLVFKNSVWKSFITLGSYRKTILGSREENMLSHPGLNRYLLEGNAVVSRICYKPSRYKSEALRPWPQGCNNAKPTLCYSSSPQLQSNSWKTCSYGSGCSFYRTLSC